MSYKFDSPFMALALISPIIPFLFLKKKFTFFIVSVLAILITLNTYQSANSIYIILSMFATLMMLLNKYKIKIVIKNLFLFMLSYISAMGIYKLFILAEVNTYVSSDIIKENLVKGVLKNIKTTLNIYKDVFHNTSFEYIFYILSLFFLLAIFRKSKINKFNALALGFIFIFISVIFSQGAYLILEKPLFTARALNAIGLIIAVLFIYSLNFKFLNLSKIFVFFGAYFLIIQANSYANALQAQENYAQMRMKLMYSDLNKIAPIDGKFNVYVKIGIGHSPVAHNSVRNFPLINALIFQYISSGYWWGSAANFYNIGLKGNYCMDICFKKENKIIKIIDTHMHKITQYDNNCFIVEYK